MGCCQAAPEAGWQIFTGRCLLLLWAHVLIGVRTLLASLRSAPPVIDEPGDGGHSVIYDDEMLSSIPHHSEGL